MANTEQPEDRPKSKFDIERLSETTRKKIFGISIFVLTLTIVIAWIPSLQSTLNQIRSGPKKPILGEENFEKIQNDLNTMINQTKADYEEIQKKIDQLNQLAASSSATTVATSTKPLATSTATSSRELSPDEMKLLKEKILEQID
ncbi:MAG: hypothetical protein HUU49_04545 [Candidatus Buchananbacteria bacterium]|nr:hypothetical protein [Candidatus Buchananbacteria bacterium]